MTENTNNMQFPFHKDFPSGSTIVEDFERLVTLANGGYLELSNTNLLSNRSSIMVNDELLRKLNVLQKRPALKSYPNVISLFILFRISGLSRIEQVGKKKFLKTNSKTVEEWNALSHLEKYFTLVALVVTTFSFEPVNDGEATYEFITIVEYLTELNGKKGESDDPQFTFYFKNVNYRTLLITFEMLGWVKITDAETPEGKGWSIKSVQEATNTKGQWNSIQEYLYNFHKLEISEEDDFKEESMETLFPELDRYHRFTESIASNVAEFSNKLKFEFEF